MGFVIVVFCFSLTWGLELVHLHHLFFLLYQELGMCGCFQYAISYSRDSYLDSSLLTSGMERSTEEYDTPIVLEDLGDPT